MINKPIKQQAVQRSEASADLSLCFFTEDPAASKCADLQHQHSDRYPPAAVIADDLYSNQPAGALGPDSLYIVLFHFTANKQRWAAAALPQLRRF